MARPRASDHDEKRSALLEKATQLFARQGFDRTSMNEIALALGVSKALFYHYYPSKDALLFDIIRDHLTDLVDAAEAANAPGPPPEERLGLVVRAILDCYRGADSQHKIQINHLTQLGAREQAELKNLERRLVDIVSAVAGDMNPELSRDATRAITMTIFGALNWKYMWFRENGRMSHEEYAALATRMFVAGIEAAAPVTSNRNPHSLRPSSA